MAAGEEALEESHEKGGMTPSPLRSEISTTTKGRIDLETVGGIAQVIESQHIGGEC